MPQFKARKTEYRGITFDSKSEAKFALYLDRRGINWIYHPGSIRLDDGYVPDFLTVALTPRPPHMDDCRCDPETVIYKESFHLQLDVIEYKPRMPTDAYVTELATRFDAIWDKFQAGPLDAMMHGKINGLGFSLITGGMFSAAESLEWNPLSREFYKISQCDSLPWGDLLVNFGDETPEQTVEGLSDYRFDLKHCDCEVAK